MSTPNFNTPNWNLPTLVMENDDELDYLYLKGVVEDANSKLKYFEITIDPGYYSSCSLNAKFSSEYYSYEDALELDNYDAEYYFGLNAKDLKKELKAEFNSLEKTMRDIAEDCGLIEIRRVAVFSNGEALYEKVGA